MKKEQVNYKVNLIGEQDLSKLPPEELTLLVAAYIDGLREYLSLPPEKRTVEKQ